MDNREAEFRHTGHARRRHQKRQYSPMAAPRIELAGETVSSTGSGRKTPPIKIRWMFIPYGLPVLKVIGIIGTVWLSLFVANHFLAGHIFPNIWTMGMSIGNMPDDAAELRLLEAWDNQIQIDLADGNRVWQVSPDQMGLRLDTRATTEQARRVGLAGIPLGYNVEPVVIADSVTAQAYLTALASQVNIESQTARFEWRDDGLIGVPGQAGRSLDIERTLANLTQSPVEVVTQRRLDLVVSPVPPEVTDPAPYLEQADRFISQPLMFIGYDPFRDESITWSTTPEVAASWLEVTTVGLELRDEVFTAFVEAQNANLHTTGADRYLDPDETVKATRQAVIDRKNTVALRIRYHPTTYTVAAGDTGYRIARRTGIPFYLIQDANPGFDLSVLSPGDTLNLPSRDAMVPLPPLTGKRIIVNLDTQYLTAYENEQPVFGWSISSGIAQAPTSPGIFQILSHEPVAYGSSYTLCGDSGCGQWKMEWFMGIYEVTPGLVNGFHGAVLLPNGAYLGGGNVGTPYTLGCVMSQNDNAERLFEWAEEGTLVEIISGEFQPQSNLGRMAVSGT